jgi:arabinofuranosyltransferase
MGMLLACGELTEDKMAESAGTDQNPLDLDRLWKRLAKPHHPSQTQRGRGTYRTILLSMLLLSAVIILKGAWMCDDSFIVMRVIDNWLKGLGLTWNTSERVQVFTCPLWVFVLAPFHALTGEIFFTVVFVSLAVTCAALWLTVTRVLGGTASSIGFLASFVFSKTLVDFSTSGLEVPLSYLVLTGFVMSLIHLEKSEPPKEGRAVLLTFLLAALALMTRLDHFCLVAPALVFVILRRPFSRRRIKPALLGLLPLVAWEMFSLFYYGALVPNTAYAKLNTGVPSALYLEQGLYYLRNLVTQDPAGFAVFLGIGVGLASRRQSKAVFWIAVGVALHVLYVVRVGGDHMTGRFFAPDAFVALTILFLSKALPGKARVAAAGFFILLGIAAEFPPLFTPGNYSNRELDSAGVADERGFYNKSLGFVAMSRWHYLKDTPWAQAGREARLKGRHSVVQGMVGCFGYFAGPEVHIIDPLALTEPLLARLPSNATSWRIGHFRRKVPVGFNGAVLGNGKLADPFLRSYYDRLKLITRGDLFGLERLKAIWKMNTGAYDYLLDAYLRSLERSVPYKKVAVFRSREGEAWNEEVHLTFGRAGIVIQTPQGSASDPAGRPDKIELSLRGGHSYVLELWRVGNLAGRILLDLEDQSDDEMWVRQVRVPAQARLSGYGRIFIRTEEDDRVATLGHLRLSPFEFRMREADVKPKPVSNDPTAPPPGPAYRFGGKALVVQLEKRRYSQTINLAVSGDDTYRFEVRRGGKTVFSGVSPKTHDNAETMPRSVSIPAEIAAGGYDELVLDPIAGTAPCHLKHVL